MYELIITFYSRLGENHSASIVGHHLDMEACFGEIRDYKRLYADKDYYVGHIEIKPPSEQEMPDEPQF